MDDKQFKAQRKRVRALWAKWREVLGLYAWDVSLNYYRGPFELDGEVSFDASASAKVNWEYQRATLSFNLVCVMDMSDAALEEMVVHECTHILVREMRQDWACSDSVLTMPHEERVTTLLSRALIEARRAD